MASVDVRRYHILRIPWRDAKTMTEELHTQIALLAEPAPYAPVRVVSHSVYQNELTVVVEVG